MPSKLEPYDLSGEKLKLVQQCFSEPEPEPILRVYKNQPKPSELRKRITEELNPPYSPYPPQLLNRVISSVLRTWDDFHNGSVSPNEFMRAPIGASFEVVEVPGKGRGMVASRDIKAGEIVLQETPLMILPPPEIPALFLLCLPQKALEAVLLLHNAHPDKKPFSSRMNIPKHRLLDQLVGNLSSNAFGAFDPSCGGKIGLLLLRSSLFNHSENSNLVRDWDSAMGQLVFKSKRDIKEGEELEIDYLPDQTGKARAKSLKENYGAGIL